MSRTVQITFDAADPNGLAEFWNQVLGYTFQPPPDGFDTWDDALDRWGVPEEDRNMASASIDPDERGPRRGSRAATSGWPRSRPSASASWPSAAVESDAPSRLPR